jgi:hypothetical protein
MILPGTYQNGFAPRDGEPLFPELWRGCVGAWNPGLGPTGLTLSDWSPYKNHGTLTNMPANDGWKVSQGKAAMQFVGTDATENIPGSQNRIQSAGNFNRSTVSWSAWVQPQSANKRGIASDGPNNLSPNFAVTILADLRIEIYRGNSTVSAQSIGLDRWNHLFIANDGISTSYFFDGRFVNSALQGWRQSTQSQIFIGYNYWGAINGLIDDVAVYNRVLSPNEIRLLASRRGIAYEVAPRNWSAQQIAAYRARYYSQVIGSGVI